MYKNLEISPSNYTKPKANVRDYSLDNIRFLLIFLVVFAHLLEKCPFAGRVLTYKTIYSFHIPAFIFLFGYNIKQISYKKIIFRWCIPYIVFQTLYILFAIYVLKTDVSLQYIKPYWILWYMPVCVYYQVLLPVYSNRQKHWQGVILLSSFLIACLVGFTNFVNPYFALSRFFVFQPWFILGFYCRKNAVLEKIVDNKRIKFWLLVLSFAAIIGSVIFLHLTDFPLGLLYGAYSYAISEGTMWMRTLLFVISFSWIVFIFVGLKPFLNKKVGIITTIGQNTWPVFLLHGFVIKTIQEYCPQLPNSFCKVIILSLLIALLFGNKMFQKVVSFRWLENFCTKQK